MSCTRRLAFLRTGPEEEDVLLWVFASGDFDPGAARGDTDAGEYSCSSIGLELEREREVEREEVMVKTRTSRSMFIIVVDSVLLLPFWDQWLHQSALR